MWLLILKIVLQIFAVVVMILVNLLDYVTRDKRTRRFKITRFMLFVVSGVFLIASIVVLVLDDHNKRDEIQKLTHPISDVSVSFQVSIPLLHPSLESYRKHFESEMNKVISEFTTSQKLIYNLSIRNNHSVNIPHTSLLFPNNSSEKLAYYLINHVGLSIEFYKSHKKFHPSLKDPDFRFNVYASIDGQPSSPVMSPYYGHAVLSYDFLQKQLAVDALSCKPIPMTLKNNRKITSIPDLEDSLMVLQFFGFYFTDNSDPFPNIKDAIHDLDDAKRAVAVDTVALKISGQEFRFLQSVFQQYQVDNDMRRYAVRFNKARL